MIESNSWTGKFPFLHIRDVKKSRFCLITCVLNKYVIKSADKSKKCKWNYWMSRGRYAFRAQNSVLGFILFCIHPNTEMEFFQNRFLSYQGLIWVPFVSNMKRRT